MKTSNPTKKLVILLMVICSILMLCMPASAKNENSKEDSINSSAAEYNHPRKTYAPITKIDLGVKSLKLDVGKTYTFKIKYEPAEPYYYSLQWTVTNDAVISIDPSKNEVKALAPGNARILAESMDGTSYTFCDVTVTGSSNATTGKAAADLKNGSSLINISNADKAKITARSLKRNMELLSGSTMSASSYAEAGSRVYMVSANVKPGTEEAQRKRALNLGMSKAEALTNLNLVNLRGTLGQILSFTSGNPDLIEIFELDNSYITDPSNDGQTQSTGQKSMDLRGYTEELTSISKVHNAGLKGSGASVAVIDTGLNSNHVEFSGRVIYEHCFSSNYTYDANHYFEAACRGGREEYTDAWPYTWVPSAYNHGSHTTGIAAGRDGIAPDAKIVAVQAFSDYIWWCTAADAPYYYWKTINGKAMCFNNLIQYQDKLSAYNWLLGIQNTLKNSNKPQIAAVNMSIGGGKYSSTCDSEDGYTEYNAYAKMISAGMVPVVSTGNSYYDGYIGLPSCKSNAFRVGALYNQSTPRIANYSNHSNLVDMLAPGTNILSAFFAYESGASSNSCASNGSSTNCYGYYSGTSMAAPMVTGAMAILKAANPALTVSQLEEQIKDISARSVNTRLNGTKFSYYKPILDFSTYIPFTLEDSRIRGKNREIVVSIPYNSKMTDSRTGDISINWSIYNMDTKKWVVPDSKLRFDSTGRNLILNFTGTQMTNGQVYRLHLAKYEMTNGQYTKSSTLVKYGMPIANVYGATVVAGNKTMVINNKHREPTSGARYMIFDGLTEIEFASHYGTKSNTSWTYSSLSNGKLYYVVAVPYRIYNSQYLWGPNQNRIYFIPMSPASQGRVSFSNSSTAVVSIASDSAANGIRVLYRTTGGKLMNGCEGTGTSCTIRNLNSNTGYEFYAMKYKVSGGKKYYSMGTLITYRSTASGLSAPQSNPTVAMSNSGNTVFTIKLSSGAQGISVLYRVAEGNFQQACESASNSCSTYLDTSKRYTFYIMQYRTVSGKKVYSPGIVARDFSSGKSIDAERLYTDFELADESISMEEIAGAMDSYLSEDMLLMAEASQVMGISPDLDILLDAGTDLYGKVAGDNEQLTNNVELDWNLDFNSRSDNDVFAQFNEVHEADAQSLKNIKWNKITIKSNSNSAAKSVDVPETEVNELSGETYQDSYGMTFYVLGEPYSDTYVPSFRNK